MTGGQEIRHTVYDKAKWHYEAEDFPPGMPCENGGTHIAFFLRWSIEMDFYSKQMAEDFSEEIMLAKAGRFNYRHLLMIMDGVLTSEDLNTKGNAFASAYYGLGKSKFAREVGYYLDDIDNFAKENLSGADYYFMENSDENYYKIKSIIDSRYSDFLRRKQLTE